MRGVSVGGGGGVDDRVMCFSINWSISASEDWFRFRPCVGHESGWGDGGRSWCAAAITSHELQICARGPTAYG